MGSLITLRRWILEEVSPFLVVISGILGTSLIHLTRIHQTNIVVTSLTACCVLYTRAAGVAYFALGAVCCSLSVKLVKRLIRQVS